MGIASFVRSAMSTEIYCVGVRLERWYQMGDAASEATDREDALIGISPLRSEPVGSVATRQLL